MRTVVLRHLSMAVICVALPIAASNLMAQDVSVGESSPGQVQVSEKRKTEFYGALSILGTMPKDENLNVGGTTIPNTNVKGSVGVGAKARIFPEFAGGVFGVEGEFFGHGGKLSAPQAQSDLTVVNFMVNVLARYPGEIIQPYVGQGLACRPASSGMTIFKSAPLSSRASQETGPLPINSWEASAPM